MLKSLWRGLYPAVFFGLAGFALYGLWLIEPMILHFHLACLLMMFVRYTFNVKFWLTKWANNIMTSLDQYWQVVFSPILNLAPDLVHRFGNEDETASSVVGKNLRDTNARHWIAIEKVLSVVLEGGRPHSLPSIEDDES